MCLVEPADRIVRYVDITSARRRREDLERPDVSSWHGMMTSVVACGNGALSTGFYRGVASEARLVLVKVGDILSAVALQLSSPSRRLPTWSWPCGESCSPQRAPRASVAPRCAG